MEKIIMEKIIIDNRTDIRTKDMLYYIALYIIKMKRGDKKRLHIFADNNIIFNIHHTKNKHSTRFLITREG